MGSRSKALPIMFMIGNGAFIGIFLAVLSIYKPIVMIPDLFASIPGTIVSDASLILFLPHLLVPITSIGLASVLIRFYTKFGRWFKFGQYSLGLHEYSKRFSTRELIGRALYVAYFSLTLGLMATQFYVNLNLEIVLNSTSSTLLIFTLLLSPIAAVVQAPMWWTEDLGIMLIRKTGREPVAPDIASVGRFMNAVTRGFITISTPLLYISILTKEMKMMRNIFPLLLMILFPLALVGYFIPFQYWFARRFPKFKLGILPQLKLQPITIKCSVE